MWTVDYGFMEKLQRSGSKFICCRVVTDKVFFMFIVDNLFPGKNLNISDL